MHGFASWDHTHSRYTNQHSAYHFRIPLYHTTSKLIKISPNTGLIPVKFEHCTHADVSAGCYTIEYEKNTTAARLHYPPDDDDDRGVVGRGGVVPRLGRALRKGDDVFYEESKSGARLPAVIIMVESPTTNDEGGRPAYVVAVRQTTGAIRLLGTS